MANCILNFNFLKYYHADFKKKSKQSSPEGGRAKKCKTSQLPPCNTSEVCKDVTVKPGQYIVNPKVCKRILSKVTILTLCDKSSSTRSVSANTGWRVPLLPKRASPPPCKAICLHHRCSSCHSSQRGITQPRHPFAPVFFRSPYEAIWQ